MYFICVLYEKGVILSKKYSAVDIGIAWEELPLIILLIYLILALLGL